MTDPFGGPETERDRARAQHEPRQLGGGPQLVCSVCDTPWPCEATDGHVHERNYDGWCLWCDDRSNDVAAT